ncbi:MAG: orotate phosphoribosyltransferase, partial [Bacteroidota bacterium]|nr:orotate phosphoribosyltransferase [Bacteroidota bacterium]
GKSSFDVVIKLKNDNYKVSGLIAIFTYDFNISKENAENNNIKFYTLTDYNILLEEALRMKYISDKDLQLLKEWRKAPEKWGK